MKSLARSRFLPIIIAAVTITLATFSLGNTHPIEKSILLKMDSRKLDYSDFVKSPNAKYTVVNNGVEIRTNQYCPELISFNIDKADQDVSGYSFIAADIHNSGDKDILIVGKLNKSQWSRGAVYLKPGESKTLLILIYRKRYPSRDPRAKLFKRLRGGPGGHFGTWENLNTRKLQNVTIFPVDTSIRKVHIKISNLRAMGKYTSNLPTDFFPFVDRYGQFKHGSWPGKTITDTDLHAALKTEEAYLSKINPLKDRSKYGGWLAGPKLKATGHFRVEKVKGKWWFVDPEGYLFWSHGIDCMGNKCQTPFTDSRKKYFAEIPDEQFMGIGKDKRIGKYINFAEANLAKKLGKDWMKKSHAFSIRRLNAWGINTIGCWSDPKITAQKKIPYTIFVKVKFNNKTLKDGSFRKALQAKLKEKAAVAASDPWCIGCFINNEIAWYNYHKQSAKLFYSICADEMKKLMPNKLYMGSRVHGHHYKYGTTNEIAKLSAEYCDVITVNRYRYTAADLSVIPPYDKPILIGEFHFGALDRGLLHPGLRATGDQQQRAQMYRYYVKSCLRNPNIIGSHWFRYRSMSVTGRFDGENKQIGFVDISDRPYWEIIHAARAVSERMYQYRIKTSNK